MAMTFAKPDQVDPARPGSPGSPPPTTPGDASGRPTSTAARASGPAARTSLEAERLGFEGTLDLLLRGRPDAEEVEETLIDVGRIAAERDDSGDLLRGWWLYGMLQGGHPLREKMTLFWHNHFATSLAKVRYPALMFRQNGLLRQHALGRFGPFLQAMSRTRPCSSGSTPTATSRAGRTRTTPAS